MTQGENMNKNQVQTGSHPLLGDFSACDAGNAVYTLFLKQHLVQTSCKVFSTYLKVYYVVSNHLNAPSFLPPYLFYFFYTANL